MFSRFPFDSLEYVIVMLGLFPSLYRLRASLPSVRLGTLGIHYIHFAIFTFRKKSNILLEKNREVLDLLGGRVTRCKVL